MNKLLIRILLALFFVGQIWFWLWIGSFAYPAYAVAASLISAIITLAGTATLFSMTYDS